MLMCNSCLAGCCRSYSIYLSGYDILTISRTLDVPIDFFVDIVKLDDDANIEFYSKQSALFKFTDNDAYHLFSLKQTDSLVVPNVKKCMFLQEFASKEFNPDIGEGLVSRCGIYDCKPLGCSAFPAKFTEGNGGFGLLVDYSSKMSKNPIPYYNLCPKEIEKEDYLYYSEELLKKITRFNYELGFFKLIASSWNNAPASREKFWAFLNNVYASRVTCESALRD